MVETTDKSSNAGSNTTTSTKQLPVQSKPEEGGELMQEQEFTTMYGARFPQVVKELFEKSDLNLLESGLLDKYLSSDWQKMPANLAGLAKNILNKREGELSRRAKKDLEKAIALFDKHEFWSHQPVQTVYDLVEKEDFNKPVEQKDVSEIREEPLNLPGGFVWSEIDMKDEDQVLELYHLLKNHYVEDSHGEFRFDYSTDFLKWALNPPGCYPEWIIGVRDTKKKNLYACITGIPVHMTVLGKPILMAEINFLCAHKNLR